MAIDKSDPFPGLPRPGMFGPNTVVNKALLARKANEAANTKANIANGDEVRRLRDEVAAKDQEIARLMDEVAKLQAPLQTLTPVMPETVTRNAERNANAERQRRYRERKRAKTIG